MVTYRIVKGIKPPWIGGNRVNITKLSIAQVTCPSICVVFKHLVLDGCKVNDNADALKTIIH